MEFAFRVIRASSGVHLLGVHIDHYTPLTEINEFCGTKVVELCGGGIGVNLLIVNEEVWSQKIANYVDDSRFDTEKLFTLRLPGKGALEGSNSDSDHIPPKPENLL